MGKWERTKLVGDHFVFGKTGDFDAFLKGDPALESLMREPFECPTPSAMAYDLIKALRVWEWFDRSYLSRCEGFQYNNDGFPKSGS